MKECTEVVFILDASGSMSDLKEDTIGGFNSMLENQREKQETTYISTILFNRDYRILHDRKLIQKVKPLTKKDYIPYGSTALLDAIGKTIRRIDHIHKRTPKENRPTRTLFVIMTDGMENASMDYTYGLVKAMINQQKLKYDWEFIFLGANIDVDIISANLGISKNKAVKYHSDHEGTQLNFQVVDKVVTRFRESSEHDYEGCLEEIKMDFIKRNN